MRTQICRLSIFLQLFFFHSTIRISRVENYFVTQKISVHWVRMKTLKSYLRVSCKTGEHRFECQKLPITWWNDERQKKKIIIGFSIYSLWKLSRSYKSLELRTYNCGNSETNQVMGWVGFLVRQDTPELCALENLPHTEPADFNGIKK